MERAEIHRGTNPLNTHRADDSRSEHHLRVDALSPERRALLAKLLQQRGGGQVPEHDSAGVRRPSLVADPAARHEPFPLNDLQQAYWIGRGGGFEMGNVASHCYLELEADFDLERLAQALRRLIARHHVLRVVISPDGLQRVLESVPPYHIEVQDLRERAPEAVAAELEGVRQRLSHQVLPSDRWPLFEVRASRLADRRVRLHVSLDALILDGWSISLLFKEWAALYRAPESALPPLELTFRDYVVAEAGLPGSEEYRRSETYWQERAPLLPPAPELPLAISPGSLAEPRFVRRTLTLEPALWAGLQKRAAQADLTSTGVLLACYADVLALWSSSPRFTLNVPRFNRLPLHPQASDILGEFASFGLLEVDNTGQESFQVRARRHQRQLWADLDHAAYSGVRVMRELSRVRDGQVRPSMPVVFTSAPRDSSGSDAYPTIAAGELGEVVYAINQTSQVWLDNHVYEHAGALVCDWDTVEALFPPGCSESMLEAYVRLLQRLATEEDVWNEPRAATARWLLPPAQRALRATVNSTQAPVPPGVLHTLVAEQVARRPEQAAVVSSRRTLTYEELHSLSTRWGRHLRQRGARPNTLVAVVMEKGWEQVVAALGTLQSGAAYLPVDPAVPGERLRYLLEQGEVEIVLTQSWLDRELEWPDHVRRLWVDSEEVAGTSDQPLDALQQPDDLASCIFTSGSTGQPKGVMITHRGVLNAIVHTNASFNVGPADRVLALTALHHDMSFYDLFGVLAAGGTLVMPSHAGRRDPAHWSQLMVREQVTIWNSVPAMMEMLLEYAADRQEAVSPSLRLAFLGGDWIPLGTPGRLHTLAPDARVVSVGGPTETTLWNIWFPVEVVDPAWKSIPYGRPIANTRYYVLNDTLADCPDWVAGEMYCGGVGVARGYWRDDEQTRARFIDHPSTGERLYRTGDLGRYLPDGNLEFLGRADFQVKIQGQRIELGEIEAALQEHPGVRAAVAAAIGEPQGKKRLVAYVVPRETSTVAADELRRFLSSRLPEHMVPSAYISLESLPLSSNGKVDRRALPVPDAPETVRTVEPEEQTVVAKIAGIVAEVLGIEQPDPSENLLRLGANSLDMVRIGNRLETEFGSRPRMDEIFRLQTIAALAGYYQERQLPTRTPRAELASSPATGVETLVARYRVLLDPADRAAFKKRQPGIRRGNVQGPAVQLARPPMDDVLRQMYAERRSHRRFSLKSISAEQFGTFLSCLMQITLDGGPKYRYASPGGLYPTQTYLHVKPGRIGGVPEGTYYYHPIEHQLVALQPGAQLDRTIHIPFINTPIFDEAAFSIFLIAQLDAIGPGYGEHAVRFATLEAGIMAHLLETAAPAAGLGLCQIGSIEFDRVRHLFDLDESHVLFHSLVGGLVERGQRDPGAPASIEAQGQAQTAANLLQRIKQLSPAEARALLDATRPRGS